MNICISDIRKKIEDTLRKKLDGRPLVVYGEAKIFELYTFAMPELFRQTSYFVSCSLSGSINPNINVNHYTKEDVKLMPSKHFVIMMLRHDDESLRNEFKTLGFVEDEDYIDLISLEKCENSSLQYGLEALDSPVAFVHDPSYIPDSLRELYTANINTGNLVHWHAVKCSIPMRRFDASNCDDVKVLVSLGFICLSPTKLITGNQRWLFKFGRYANILPLCLGIVCEKDASPKDVSLSPEVYKLVCNLSNVCKLIGTRDEFTADILTKHGIRNVKPVGCPSLYYPYVAKRLVKIKRDNEPLRVVVNSATWTGTTELEKTWFDYISEKNLPYVCQSFRVSYKRINNPYLMSNRHIFTNISDWEKFVKKFNFSMGMRFHGNIVPIWNGIPSLFITHDSRVSGMCKFFSLPHIEVEDFDPSKPLEYYYELADYDNFYKKMPKLVDEYKDFLRINGIDI